MTSLRIVPAEASDLGSFVELLEDIAEWLDTRGITQWRRGSFRRAADYYAASIARGEIHLAFVGDEAVGAFRLLLHESIVWPDANENDAVYLFNLAVKRSWTSHGFGTQMLKWAAERAAARGRTFLRLDCMADNRVLADYYAAAGFSERGVVDAPYPEPIGTLRLRRFEKRCSGLPDPEGVAPRL